VVVEEEDSGWELLWEVILIHQWVEVALHLVIYPLIIWIDRKEAVDNCIMIWEIVELVEMMILVFAITQ
jgi:hypothetical protein